MTINYHKNEDAALAAKKEIEGRRRKAQIVQADCVERRRYPEARRLRPSAAFGRLDILVNNAGMETRTSDLDTTEQQFDGSRST